MAVAEDVLVACCPNAKREEEGGSSIVAENDAGEHLRPRLFVLQTDGNQMFGITEKFNVLDGHVLHEESTYWIDQRTVRCLEEEHHATSTRAELITVMTHLFDQ